MNYWYTTGFVLRLAYSEKIGKPSKEASILQYIYKVHNHNDLYQRIA